MQRAVLDEALRGAREIAAEAGALVLSGFRTGLAVRKKGPIDLLTELDLRAEELIRERLASRYPSHGVVGEEQEPTGDGELVWYVDPIDGTTNYAHGHPFFCVSMALYDGATGLVGVVCAPALGVTWWGARCHGAFRNEERCRVSTRATLDDALCATGFPYDRRVSEDDNLREHRAFLKRTQGIRRCGSAAIDLSMVADGTFDVYWEQRLHAWDMCAGALLVLEAGGRLGDYDGAHGDPRTGRLVATNGLVHEATLALLARARGT